MKEKIPNKFLCARCSQHWRPDTVKFLKEQDEKFNKFWNLGGRSWKEVKDFITETNIEIFSHVYSTTQSRDFFELLNLLMERRSKIFRAESLGE